MARDRHKYQYDEVDKVALANLEASEWPDYWREKFLDTMWRVNQDLYLTLYEALDEEPVAVLEHVRVTMSGAFDSIWDAMITRTFMGGKRRPNPIVSQSSFQIDYKKYKDGSARCPNCGGSQFLVIGESKRGELMGYFAALCKSCGIPGKFIVNMEMPEPIDTLHKRRDTGSLYTFRGR